MAETVLYAPAMQVRRLEARERSAVRVVVVPRDAAGIQAGAPPDG